MLAMRKQLPVKQAEKMRPSVGFHTVSVFHNTTLWSTAAVLMRMKT